MATKTKTAKTYKGLRDEALNMIVTADGQFTFADSETNREVLDSVAKCEASVLTFRYRKDSNYNASTYCTNCGDVKNYSPIPWRLSSCPLCRNNYTTSATVGFDGRSVRSDIGSRTIVLAIDEESIVFCRFTVNKEYTSPSLNRMPEEKDFKDVVENSTLTFTSPTFLIYKKDGALKKVTEKGFGTNVDDVYVGDFIQNKNFTEFTKFLDELSIKHTPSHLKGVFKELALVETSASKASEARRLAREKQESAVLAKYTGYVTEDAEELALSKCNGINSAEIIEEIGTFRKALLCCPCCGHIEDIVVKDHHVECPECGERVRVAPWGGSAETYGFVDFDTIGDDLVESIYSVSVVLDKASRKLEKNFYLVTRIVYTKEKCIAYNHAGFSFYKLPIERVRFPYGGSQILINDLRSRSDLKEVIMRSCLANSGLIEALGRGTTELSPQWQPENAHEYICTYYKQPIIEQVIKSGMKNLARDISLDRAAAEDPSATTIQQYFGLPKCLFKIARVNDFDYKKIQLLKDHYKLDPSIRHEDFDWSETMYPSSVGRNIVCDLMAASGLRFKKVKEYLTTLYYNQCIDYSESARLWYDYILMMDKLGFSVEQKRKEMCPSSLKKEHDILNFALKNISNQVNAEKFKETVEETRHLRYTFGDYMVSTPESAEDIIKEGIDLNHSVAQHIESVVARNEQICFIRKKSEPTKSFYTVEVRGQSIVQVRGNSNQPVLEDDVKFFLKKWARFKKLEIIST